MKLMPTTDTQDPQWILIDVRDAVIFFEVTCCGARATA